MKNFVIGMLAVSSIATSASAAIFVNLVNPAGAVTNVTPGTTIVARILARTDNANGIAALAARVSTSTQGIDSASLDATPFTATVKRATGANTAASSQPVLTFGSALTGPSNLTLLPPTLAFDAFNVPTSTTSNRPSIGVNMFSVQNNRTDGNPFFSTTLVPFVDVEFLATGLPGETVYFSLNPNPGIVTEFAGSTGTIQGSNLGATTFLSTGGFQVNIVSAANTPNRLALTPTGTNGSYLPDFDTAANLSGKNGFTITGVSPGPFTSGDQPLLVLANTGATQLTAADFAGETSFATFSSYAALFAAAPWVGLDTGGGAFSTLAGQFVLLSGTPVAGVATIDFTGSTVPSGVVLSRVAAVPEPTSIAALSLVGAGLMARRRRA